MTAGGDGPPRTADGGPPLAAVTLARWRAACRRGGHPLDADDDTADAMLLQAVLQAGAEGPPTGASLVAVTEAARRWVDPTTPVRDQLTQLAELRAVVVGALREERSPEGHDPSLVAPDGRRRDGHGPREDPTQRLQAVHEALDRAVVVVTEGALDAATALARTDPLTGTGNRRALQAMAPTVLAADQRAHRRTAVVMVDVDGLKQRNDSAGHAAGDRTLVDVAHGLVRAVRRSDLVFRVGGDEFVILLSVTVPADVATVMARAELAGAPRCTWGAAVTPDDGRTLPELLAAADRRLYALRANGEPDRGGTPPAASPPPLAAVPLAGRIGDPAAARGGPRPALVSRRRAGHRRPGGWRPGRPAPPG
jgi:diguanylate cyclase (GGDEF)-like protein